MKVVYNYVIKCNLTKIKCCSVKAMSSICRFMAVCQGSVGKIIIPPVLVLIVPLLSYLGWLTPPPLPPPIRSKLIDVYCICSWTNHKKRKSLKFWFFNIIIFLSNMTRYFIATLLSIHLRINRNSKMLMFSCRRYRLCRGRNPYMYIT